MMKGLTKEQERELVEKWIPYIRNVVARCQVPFDLRSDAVQDVVSDIIEGGYMNLYDPSKGSLNTFLYAMTKKRVMGRMSRRGKDALRRATLVGDRDWLADNYVDDREPVVDSCLQGEFWAAVAKLRTVLEGCKRRARKNADGTKVVRTKADVLDGLILGKSQVAIAREMGYSEATVSVIINEIRSLPEALFLHEVSPV